VTSASCGAAAADGPAAGAPAADAVSGFGEAAVNCASAASENGSFTAFGPDL